MNTEAVQRWIEASKRATERSAYIETLALLRRVFRYLTRCPVT